MTLSEDRQKHLAHTVINGLWEADLVDYTDEETAMRAGKVAMAHFVEEMKTMDVKVRNSISKLKRKVPEGSTEWDVMYQKYYEEEMKRRGIS